MARPKKSGEKGKVGLDEFIATRDAVVTGLSTLQSAVQDLSRAYIAHTNTVLGKGPNVAFEPITFANPMAGENGLFSARGPTPPAAAAAAAEPTEGKKRKRAPHDKNAPKRALTPFFLYLQTERGQIGSELGAGHTAKEVQDEGGKRWNSMSATEQGYWQEKYGINFARYQEHMKAYKAGLPLPEVTDAEAKKIYEKNKKEKADKQGGKIKKVEEPVSTKAPVVAEEDDDDDDDTSDSSSDEETPEPPKEPTPPPAKKQKGSKESAKKKAAPSKPEEPVATPAVARGSPEKKKKKSSKKESLAAAPAPVVSSPPKPLESAQKSKKKGKKNKSGEFEA